jgi:release factor glutamine methyltransferase
VPVSPTPAEQDALVRRLRAAGCVVAEDEAALLLAEAPDAAALEAMAARRVAGDPLEQVLGWAEFCGLRVAVAPGVFVPRRRTELLARTAIDLLAAAADRDARAPAPVAVDLCCGTGAVGAAVLAALPGVEVWACDLDPSATACTERNLPGPAAAGRVRTGDLAAPLPADLRGRVDVLTANAPYVPTAAIALMPPEAREHEPGLALDGGADGVDLHRRVAALAPGWLRPGGHLLIETSTRQADATVAACAAHGLTARVLRDEDLDATVVHATA